MKTSTSSITLLRTALQSALDELRRINCGTVRPDVLYVGDQALAKTLLPPIENASSETEQRIVGKLVCDLLDAGYCLTIWNGGDEAELERSTDKAAIFAALAATDQDEIEAFHPSSKRCAGWVRLVWGNDCAVISDYTTNFESVLAGANALADELEG